MVNIAKTVIGGILTIAGIGISYNTITAPSNWIEDVVVVLLTLGAAYICYEGIAD